MMEFSHVERGAFTGAFVETYFDSEARIAVVRTTAPDGTATYTKRFFAPEMSGRMIEEAIEADEAEALITNQTRKA